MKNCCPNYIYIYIYIYNHVTLPTRISLALFRHPSQSSKIGTCVNKDERDTKRKKKNGEIEEKNKKKNVTDREKEENQNSSTTKNRKDEKGKEKHLKKTVSKLLIGIFFLSVVILGFMERI